MKLDMYIMAPEPITTAYCINPSHQSLCLFVYPLIVARQRLGKNVMRQQIHLKTEELSDGLFLCGPFRMKESRRLVLPRTSCLYM
jgi:hypothetical protein